MLQGKKQFGHRDVVIFSYPRRAVFGTSRALCNWRDKYNRARRTSQTCVADGGPIICVAPALFGMKNARVTEFPARRRRRCIYKSKREYRTIWQAALTVHQWKIKQDQDGKDVSRVRNISFFLFFLYALWKYTSKNLLLKRRKIGKITEVTDLSGRSQSRRAHAV